MDLDSNPDILLVRKHLVEHLGAPEEVYEVRGSPRPSSPVQVLHLSYFAPGGPESPVVYATCGACLFQMKDGRRVEAMMLFRRAPAAEATPAIHRILSSFAVFSESTDEAVRVGDVVRAPDDLHRFCPMDALLFLPPVAFVESFHSIPLEAGRSADLLWLLPVFEAEADYAVKHGPQTLMMLFAAQGLDVTALDRDEANTLVRPEDARALAAQRSEDEAQRQQAERAASTRTRGPARPTGAGGAEVADVGDAVVVRRGAAKPSKPTTRPAHLSVVPTPAEQGAAPSPRAPQPAPPRAHGSGAAEPGPRAAAARRPAVVSAPKAKETVRFDLKTGQRVEPSGGRRPSGPEAPAKPPAPAVKPATPPPTPAAAPKEPPETPEEAKRKRIADLKAKAAEAAKRAAERAAGTQGGPAPRGDPSEREPG